MATEAVAQVRIEPPDAFDRVERRIRRSSDVARDEFRRLAPTGEALLRSAAPHGPTGEYGRQVTSHVKGDQISVYSRVRYRVQVEIGRRPGKMPPPSVIARRMGLPSDQAFLVARAIGRRGHRGLHPVERARSAMGAEISRSAALIAEAMKGAVEGV